MRRRKKDELIPLEKSRRVIYIEKRGPERKHMSVGSILLYVLGVLCLVYCVGIFLSGGYGTKFFLIWAVIGAVLIGLGRLISWKSFMEWLPAWVKAVFCVLVCLGALVFAVVEGMILSQFGASPPEGADYCIILGAQLRASGPSNVLKRRLDAAVSYLEDNPDTQAIVSGGQGANEPMTEAQGMYDYLVEAGIEPERILMEDCSENTQANLANSSLLLDKEEDTVVLVTNNFHMLRALGVAKKQGYAKVYGLAASSYAPMLPNNLLREFFGVAKDFLAGNL